MPAASFKQVKKKLSVTFHPVRDKVYDSSLHCAVCEGPRFDSDRGNSFYFFFLRRFAHVAQFCLVTFFM